MMHYHTVNTLRGSSDDPKKEFFELCIDYNLFLGQGIYTLNAGGTLLHFDKYMHVDIEEEVHGNSAEEMLKELLNNLGRGIEKAH